ncbi:hypothetical protein D3C77_651440 [compost metagenome]
MLSRAKNLKEIPQLAQRIALQGVAQLLCRLILDVAISLKAEVAVGNLFRSHIPGKWRGIFAGHQLQ